MRCATLLSLACLFLLLGTPANAGDPPVRIAVSELDETPRQKMLRQVAEKLLKKELPEHEWKDAALSTVLSDLEAASGLRFDLRWQAMELVGIDGDSLVSHKAGKRTLPETLNAVLAQVSADAFDDDMLGFAIQDGNLVISTRREIKSVTVSRTYNVGPLLREPYRPVGMYFSDEAFEDTVAFHAWLRGEREAPLTDAMLLKIYKYHHEKMAKELAKLDPDNAVKGEKPPDHGGGLFGVGDPEREDPNAFVQPALDDLKALIKNTASDQHDWLDDEYLINVSGDLLIIKASVPAHEQIETLLNRLLQAEIDKQANILKDAHASQQVAQANQCLKDGDKLGALEHVNQALWIMPDHVPANAMKQVLESMGDKPKPVN